MIDINITLPDVNPPEKPTPQLREFLTPLPQSGHYLLVLDSTAIGDIMKCPTYAMNRIIYRREAHAKDAALTFGGAIHEGIKGLLLGESTHQQDQRIAQYFAENPSPPDEYRTPTMAMRVMAHYRVEDVGWEILMDGDEKLIEKPFEIPLGYLDVNANIQLPDWPEPRFVEAIHVALSGRLDLLAKINGKNRVVDHKTTSIAGDQYVQGFQLSHQVIGYTWAAQQIWPELDITGFCLNVIGLKRVQSDTANLVMPGVRGGRPPLEFFKSFFDYTQDRLDEWEINTLTIVSDFVLCLTRNYFPMYTNSCFAKYGKCQYHDACTIENRQVRMRFLQSDSFKPVTWDPTL